MNNDHHKKSISRLHFIKTTGVMAAGLTVWNSRAISSLADKNLGKLLLINGSSTYKIVIPAGANPVEREAAEELQHYLSNISKININIIEENNYKGKSAIYIGRTNFAKTKKINFSQLNEDGYTFKPAGNNFIIAGGSAKGVLYGVYSLLESLGFRKYTSAYTHVPTTNSIMLPKTELVDIPSIKYRSISYRDTHDPGYSSWHKLSSRDNWGLFVHTFNGLVPPEEYAKTHPEYYTLRNGNRLPGTQLCLSNQEVADIVVVNLRKKIAGNAAPLYWSVSQNDNDQYCQCDACKALNEKYGGEPSGSILYFVNKIAKEFPDKIISTLAYWYSRTAPKNIRAESNVNIMLCNIESKRHKPVFESDPAFANDLKQWGQLAGSIIIWDYNIQFANLVSPFPNLHTIKPNIKFYTANNVNSLFMQANSQAGGEMAALRAYLISKLMWNPDADDNAIINDFLNGYYGAGGSFIRKYIETMREALLKSNFQLSIFGDPIDAKDTYLSPDLMNEYKQLFDSAETALSKETELLKRVRIARLPIMYAEIQIGRQEVDTPRSMFKRTNNGSVVVKPEMKTLLQEFVDGCNEEGVTRLRERSTPPNDYLQSYNRIFMKMDEMSKSLSLNKKILPTTLPGQRSNGVEGLTDGIFGSYESWSNPDIHWVGYEGRHMDFVLDLAEVMSLQSVNMDFLNAQAQPDWNLLVLPTFVTYATSVDGQNYSEAIKVVNPHNPNPKENPDIDKVQVQSYFADMKNVRARYIKVHAESLLHLPSWHIRTGKAAWIYCDEIVVM